MPNPKTIVRASEFDPALLNFDPVDQRVYIQTINLSCRFGVSVYEDPKTGQKSYSIDVAFKDLDDHHTKAFYDTMFDIDFVTRDKAVDLSKDWFGKEMPMEMIREFYRPLIKHPKDPRYSPTMKIKIPVDKSGVPTAEIYNEAKELVSLDSREAASPVFSSWLLSGLSTRPLASPGSWCRPPSPPDPRILLATPSLRKKKTGEDT
ncbi:hypothetical protein NADE_008096 [Nannochloris sp. 'desiccata']|nr:hypothetical protein KSW81_000001 [Chlorella desiccata (nom. nud.)]KAG7674343.1 hypothetical protein KSW81_000004 [Chlorella desiccata (nom. nud.)]KAH7619813.1 hypothetical protein NADE_008096 [Chlorella desiccata (nom. nud.)]